MSQWLLRFGNCLRFRFPPELEEERRSLPDQVSRQIQAGQEAAMGDPALWSFLTKVLCSHGGCMAYGALPQAVGLPERQIQELLEQGGQERFLLHGPKWSACSVLAVSPVRLCKRNACEGCADLHVCRSFLRGRCFRPAGGRWTCKYSHEVLSESNRKVLKDHELSGLNEDELRVLLLQNDPFLLPDVCPAYNKGDGNCAQGENCSRLHICRYFLRGECRFPHCKRSHRLLEPLPLKLLLQEGLGQEAAWNVQMICESRVAALSRELPLRRFEPSADPSPAANPGGERFKPIFQKAPNPKKVGLPDPVVKAAPCLKWEDAQKEKTDEICLFYVWRFCKYRSNCSMVHYDLPYRWQIFSENGWKDLPKIEKIERAYCDPSVTRFTDLGLNFETMTANATQKIRRLSTPSSVTKDAKFVMTTKWLWYWENELGQWIEYGKQDVQPHQASLDSDVLENLFLADPKGSIPFQAGTQQYQLSFRDMSQKNLAYSTQRKVRRRPKFVSSEDVKTKKGHQATAGPALAPQTAANYPATWDKSALPPIGYEALEVSKMSSEYTKIKGLFQKTMKNCEIRRIKRIQNPSLWQVFQWQKEQMKKKKGSQYVDERLLFHGTRASNTNSICTDNFDWRISGTNGTAFGKGSYFAVDARYSYAYCHDAEEKVMFLASVLVGDFVTGHATFTRPPAKPNAAGSYYDSCVDNPINPSIFVVFEKHQVYPSYVISYSEEKSCVLS